MASSTHVGDTPLTRFLATQTLAQLKDIRVEYRHEIEAAQDRLAELERELNVVDQSIAEKGGRPRPKAKAKVAAARRRAPRKKGTGKPSLRDVIRAILRDRGEPMSRQQVVDEIAARNATPTGENPRNTINTRLAELVAAGKVRATPEGLFEIGTDPQQLSQGTGDDD